MARIGVVSERKTNEPKSFFERHKRKVTFCSNPIFELVITEIPYTEESLGQTSQNRLKKTVMRAEKVLEDYAVDCIVMSRLLKECIGNENTTDEQKKLFISLLPECIRKFAMPCGIKLPINKICIRDSNPGRITEYLVRELRFDAKGFLICTENAPAAGVLAERFFEESGLAMSISASECRADIVVDVDAAKVRIGRDLIVDGIEFDFDTGGYEIESLEIASLLDCERERLKISSYLSGKKKLTLS